MLASAPVFAASFLLTKALTRNETAGRHRAVAGASRSRCSACRWRCWTGRRRRRGSGPASRSAACSAAPGHYCLTRSFRVADISATQSVKFLDLVWAALLGWLVFADLPSSSTLIGGVVICAATLWVARRESRGHMRNA